MNSHKGIFRISAIKAYRSPNPTHISFLRGQDFYVLNTSAEEGLYFVSTQYSTPFSKTAVCGLVPMSNFIIVMHPNMKSSKKAMDVAAAGAAAAAAAATVTVKRENTAAPSPAHQQQQHIITSNSHLLSSYSLTSNYPPPCSTSIVSDKVQSVSLVGLIRPIDPQTLKHTLTLPMFRIKVTRSNYEHCITRRYEDFVLLHNHLKLPNHVGCQMPPLPPPINDSTAPPLWECEAFEARVLEQAKDLNFYLQQLFNLGREIAQVVEAEGVIRFLAPRNDAELDTTKMAQPRILNTSEVKDIVDGSSQSRRRSSILRDFLHATGLDGRSKAIKT